MTSLETVISREPWDPKKAAVERIEDRASLRNLECFLNFNFFSKELLSLEKKKISRYSVKSLQKIDIQVLTWKERFKLEWEDSLSLKKIAAYIARQAPIWASILTLESSDKKNLIALEHQCALLEKKVLRHNQKNVKKIAYRNPLRKVLRLIIKYPQKMGEEQASAAIVHELSYDRLTSIRDISTRIEELLLRPIILLVDGKETYEGETKATLAVSIIPKNVFKQEIREPKELFDPQEPKEYPNQSIFTVTYQNPDWQVFALKLSKESKCLK